MSAGPYGWGWARVTGPPDGLERLVGDLHTFTATLDAAGYGPYLLCTAVCFHRGDGPQRLFIVHSPVRGTFYPFAPARRTSRARTAATTWSRRTPGTRSRQNCPWSRTRPGGSPLGRARPLSGEPYGRASIWSRATRA